MIYLDSSVLLASVFGESRSPPGTLWDDELTSSHLLRYEVWTRLNAYGLALSHGDRASARLDRVYFVELGQPTLARALEPLLNDNDHWVRLAVANALIIREK